MQIHPHGRLHIHISGFSQLNRGGNRGRNVATKTRSVCIRWCQPTVVFHAKRPPRDLTLLLTSVTFIVARGSFARPSCEIFDATNGTFPSVYRDGLLSVVAALSRKRNYKYAGSRGLWTNEGLGSPCSYQAINLNSSRAMNFLTWL